MSTAAKPKKMQPPSDEALAMVKWLTPRVTLVDVAQCIMKMFRIRALSRKKVCNRAQKQVRNTQLSHEL